MIVNFVNTYSGQVLSFRFGDFESQADTIDPAIRVLAKYVYGGTVSSSLPRVTDKSFIRSSVFRVGNQVRDANLLGSDGGEFVLTVGYSDPKEPAEWFMAYKGDSRIGIASGDAFHVLDLMVYLVLYMDSNLMLH